MSFATLPGPGSLQHGRDRLPEDRVRREIGHAAPLPRGRLTLPVGGDDLGDSLFVAQLAGVETTLRQMDAELLAQTVDLIPAHEMPAVLEALLSRSANLHMLALTSLKPEPLMAGEQKVNLFRHGIRLQLEGGYFDVYQYLKALEALPRHFYWKGFDYRVVEHPKAAVAMEIYTLSTSKEFIRG